MRALPLDANVQFMTVLTRCRSLVGDSHETKRFQTIRPESRSSRSASTWPDLSARCSWPTWGRRDQGRESEGGDIARDIGRPSWTVSHLASSGSTGTTLTRPGPQAAEGKELFRELVRRRTSWSRTCDRAPWRPRLDTGVWRRSIRAGYIAPRAGARPVLTLSWRGSTSWRRRMSGLMFDHR